MNDLREDLDRRAAGFTPGRAAYERVLDRAALRRARRRVTAGVTAFAISAAAFTGLWAATRGSDSVPVATPTQRIEAPPRHDGLEIGMQSSVGGWITLSNDAGVWVAGSTLFEVDASTGNPVAVASGPWDYDFVRLADAGPDTIWIASGTHLSRFNTSSGTITENLDVALGHVDAVNQFGSQTWITASGEAGQQVLARVDPATGAVLTKYTGIGQGVHQLVEAAGYLFIGRQGYSSLLRIDPTTGERVIVPSYPHNIPQGGAQERPTSLAVVGGHVWVDWGGYRISCVDAGTLETCGDREIEGTNLASDGGYLWLLSNSSVTLFDGNTGKPLAGPLSLPDTSPSSISANDGHAWIGFHDSGRVIRVDICSDPGCRSDRVRERIELIQERMAALSEVLHTKLASLDELRTALRRSPNSSIQTQILEVQMEIKKIEIKQAELQVDIAQLLDQIAPDTG
jgi:hypothetical protein